MKNKDVLAKKKTEIMTKLNQAMKDGNEEVFSGSIHRIYRHAPGVRF